MCLCLVPSKVSLMSCCAGAGQVCLEGEALGAAVGHRVGCRAETGLAPMLMVFRCCSAVRSLCHSFLGEQRLSGVPESLGEVG